MKNKIKVSIITVCYNSAKTIEKTIKSVLNQTYENIEYIIVDGKSTDDTLKIVNKYRKKFNNKMVVVSEKDNGIYDAMNKGIKMATGDIIGIINSDDYYEKDAVENIVKNMKKEKYQILYGYLNLIKDDICIKTIMYRHENLLNEMINHPTCFITKALYNDFGMYNTKYRSCADYEFMIRQFRNEKVKFVPVEKVIANFTLGGMSSKISSHIECLDMKREYNLISRKEHAKEKLKLSIKKMIKDK